MHGGAIHSMHGGVIHSMHGGAIHSMHGGAIHSMHGGVRGEARFPPTSEAASAPRNYLEPY